MATILSLTIKINNHLCYNNFDSSLFHLGKIFQTYSNNYQICILNQRDELQEIDISAFEQLIPYTQSIIPFQYQPTIIIDDLIIIPSHFQIDPGYEGHINNIRDFNSKKAIISDKFNQNLENKNAIHNMITINNQQYEISQIIHDNKKV